MVVIAASVCTKSGKPLVSRLFVDMSRVRIEGLLAAFPKLMGSEKQHTFIETDTIRYLYQPIESLYLLVITNKQSNIVEDLDTLHILAKLVPEYCRSANEDEIMNNAYELIFAFDEVVSMGYKENVTLSQIKTFLEMDSHDEKVHEILERNKQIAAATEAKRRQQQIEKEKSEQMRAMGGGSGMGGMGGGGMGGMGGMGSGSKMGGMGGGSLPPGISLPTSDPFVVKTSSAERAPAVAKKGMVLGKGNKANDLLKQLVDEGEIDQEAIAPSKPGSSVVASAPSSSSAAPTKREGIHLTLEEKIVLVTEYDGGLQNLEIKGDLTIYITDPNVANMRVQLGNNYDKGYQFRTHPHIDKALFTKNNLIGLKDASRAFPTGTPLGVLKWRFQTKDEALVPLSVNCWPSKGSAGTTVVNMEYELLNKNIELRDISIAIPIPGGHPPVVNTADGSYQYEHKRQTLNWSLPHVDSSNDTGSMEFTIPYGGEKYALFPIVVNFTSTKTLSGVEIATVQLTDGSKAPYSADVSLSTENYQLVYKA